MMNQFKKIIIFFVAVVSIVTLFDQKASAFIPTDLFSISGDVDSFQEKKSKEKADFLGFYYDLVKQDHFSSLYSNNLIFSAEIDNEFPQNGAIILQLIEYLEKDTNYVSKFLLKKLNSFFYLELHSFISQVEIRQEQRAHLYKAMHALYKCKGTQVDDTLGKGEDNAIYPFRTLLSQTIVSIHMALNSPERRNKQREALVFALEQLKEKFLAVNKENNLIIENTVIDEFMMLLEAYAVQEDVVNKGNIQKALYITAFVLAVVGIVGYIAYKGGFPWVKEKLGELSGEMGKFLGKNIVEQLEDRIDPMLRKGVKVFTGPDMDESVKKPGEKPSIVDKFKKDVVQTAKEAAKPLGKRFVKGALAGVDEDAEPIVEKLIDKAHKKAKPKLKELTDDFVDNAAARGVKRFSMLGTLGGYTAPTAAEIAADEDQDSGRKTRSKKKSKAVPVAEPASAEVPAASKTKAPAKGKGTVSAAKLKPAAATANSEPAAQQQQTVQQPPAIIPQVVAAIAINPIPVVNPALQAAQPAAQEPAAQEPAADPRQAFRDQLAAMRAARAAKK